MAGMQKGTWLLAAANLEVLLVTAEPQAIWTIIIGIFDVILN